MTELEFVGCPGLTGQECNGKTDASFYLRKNLLSSVVKPAATTSLKRLA